MWKDWILKDSLWWSKPINIPFHAERESTYREWVVNWKRLTIKSLGIQVTIILISSKYSELSFTSLLSKQRFSARTVTKQQSAGLQTKRSWVQQPTEIISPARWAGKLRRWRGRRFDARPSPTSWSRPPSDSVRERGWRHRWGRPEFVRHRGCRRAGRPLGIQRSGISCEMFVFQLAILRVAAVAQR